MSKLSYQVTDKMITVNFDGKTHFIPRSESLADKLIKALREGREDEIPNLITVEKRIEKFSKGTFQIRDGKVFINGQEAPGFLGNKIFRFSNEGLPYTPLVKFAEKLQLNPSFRAVNELFQFLEKNDHPITPEGDFIAYKRVRSDFKDIHSGTFDNSVGTTVEIARNQVDEDSSRTCSRGLHVANWDYAHTKFASHNPTTDVMLEVVVNPADVVAIPADYNQSKMRVCKYTVLGVVDKAHSDDVSLRITDPDYNQGKDWEEDEEEDDYEEDSEEMEECANCGDDCEPGYDLCMSCEDEDEEEEEEDPYQDSEEEDEEDEYPWRDELDE